MIESIKKLGLFWQYPVITEEEFYNQNKQDENYIAVPWATLIDKNINLNLISEILRNEINKRGRNKSYYTCCQHIYFKRIIPILKNCGIKTLYTPHKELDISNINNITIKPCPLYAVNFEDVNRNEMFKNIDYLNIKRDYLFSFQGAYQNNYMSKIRLNIFNLKNTDNAYIKNTGSWYFNNNVYSMKQNKNIENFSDSKSESNKNTYNDLLLNSRFSLCPSGSGPNSIRFWESLATGSIPVLLSDKLDLPHNINWDNAIIFCAEKNVLDIENIINNISLEEEENMRKKCIEIYTSLKNNYRNI